MASSLPSISHVLKRCPLWLCVLRTDADSDCRHILSTCFHLPLEVIRDVSSRHPITACVSIARHFSTDMLVRTNDLLRTLLARLLGRTLGHCHLSNNRLIVTTPYYSAMLASVFEASTGTYFASRPKHGIRGRKLWLVVADEVITRIHEQLKILNKVESILKTRQCCRRVVRIVEG
jgi:hypothetical protein